MASRTSSAAGSLPAFDPLDPGNVDSLLTDEERAIRETVRKVTADRVAPHVADWFERGEVDDIRGLVKEFGSVGLLGMHLEGYGCAGMSATSYGLACLELEAADSGIRSLVSVQGSLAMYAIWAFGSEEQKQEWLPGMAAGEKVGCFGLTEPDHGSDPGSMRTRPGAKAPATAPTGCSTAARCGSPTARSPTSRSSGRRPTRASAASSSRPTPPGFSAPQIKHKMSLRASVTSELVLDGVRLPADAVLPEVRGLKGPLSCLNEARFGIVWGAMGAARSSYEAALDYSRTRVQFGRPIGGFQLTQAKLADMALEYTKGVLLALHLGRLKDAGPAAPRAGQLRQAQQRARGAGDLPHAPARSSAPTGSRWSTR